MLGREVSNPSRQAQAVTLNAEAIAVRVAAFVEAAKFLLWIGLVILIIAIIAWLMRVVKRNA